MKIRLLAIAAVTFLATGACIQNGTHHKSLSDRIEGITSNGKYVVIAHKSFDGASVKVVNADLVSPDIQVTGDATGSATVEVTAGGRGIESLSKSELMERLNRNYEINIGQSGDQIDISIRYKKKNVPSGEALSFKFDVHTRKDVQARIQTVSGDIRISHVATTRTESTSGDIAVNNINGDVQAGSVSGDIKLDQITGTLSSHSTSGDIAATHIGKISNAETVSGDIHLDAGGLDGDVQLKAVSGDISLSIPEKTGADISLGTVSGDLEVADFSNTQYKSRSKRGVEATINGGGNAIKGSTVSGDITIKH